MSALSGGASMTAASEQVGIHRNMIANWRLEVRIILRHINDLRLAWFNDDRLLPGFRGLLWSAIHVSGLLCLDPHSPGIGLAER